VVPRSVCPSCPFSSHIRVTNAVSPGFTVPSAGGKIPSLPGFVYTKGTLFLLYPSRSTLDRLSGSG
jgi:hypothetical protein